MASILKVDTIQDQSGNNIINENANVITIGASGDTITIPSGASMSGFSSTGIDDNATSTAITIDSSQQVGIGTASPSHELDVQGTANTSIQAKTTGNSSVFLELDGNSSQDSLVRLRGSGTEYYHLQRDGSQSQDLRLYSYTDTAGATDILRYSINGSLRFGTNASERMRIDSSGRVGINESSPSSLLELRQSVDNTSASGLQIRNTANTSSIFIYQNGSHTVYDSGSAGDQYFKTGSSERMRINSSGNVGIGTTSPENNLHIFANNGGEGLTIKSTGDTSNAIIVDANRSGAGNTINQLLGRWNGTDVADIIFQTGSDTTNKDDGIITFRTSSANNISEKMRINSDGNLFINNTSEPSNGSNGARIANASYHIFCRNSTASVFRVFPSSGEFRIIGGGNAQNTNNSYGAISDRELKENEVDANSQWNDIKALQIKNYNLKEFPNVKHLGVIAQDLEASGMNGVVEQNKDELYTEEDVLPEGKNVGDVKEKGYKTVKYSILYMKAVKALQEAMERIETLEAKVQTLETNNP